MPAKIRIQGVSKTYRTKRGEVVALQDIDLTVAPNEFVTLVGPSGCGKSTVLRIVSALVRPTRGDVLLDERALTSPTRDIGIVFQDAVLLPWRSVLENVMLPVEILRLDRSAYRQRAQELLELVGLQGFENRYPWELSGGMQQRASICRALIYNPSILLMDEPLAALDAMTREELAFELLRIWEAHRTTILFVTHNISEAVLLADRVVAMTPRPGRIARVIQVDLPRPRTLDMEFSQEFKKYSDEIRGVIFAAKKD